MAKTQHDPALIAHIEVPQVKDQSKKNGMRDTWVSTNKLLVDLGRFMERTGIEFEITQVESTVLRCECPDASTYTALRLAYGPFFIQWPRPSSEDAEDTQSIAAQNMRKYAQSIAGRSKKSSIYPGSQSNHIWTQQTVTNVLPGSPQSDAVKIAQIDAYNAQKQSADQSKTVFDKIADAARRQREAEAMAALRRQAVLVADADPNSPTSQYRKRLSKLRDTLRGKSK